MDNAISNPYENIPSKSFTKARVKLLKRLENKTLETTLEKAYLSV
ncbi:hypothetical protein [Sulfurospirillum cavolei]|nr:hypothetical protein [Sulfurospirillum cavolei]